MIYNNLSISNQGRLEIGGVDTATLAAEYGTPLYVLDENMVRAACRTYVTAVREHFSPQSKVLFAGKALCFRGIYPIVQSEGMSADVVSPGEIHTALAAGFPADEMFFHGNAKSERDIEYALSNGVGCLVVDNIREMELIETVTARLGVTCTILIRLTPGVDPATHAKILTGSIDSKFGVTIGTPLADGLVEMAIKSTRINLLGFHCHIGSQIFDIEPFLETVDIITDYCAHVKKQFGFDPEYLNLGGGFAIRYLETQAEVDYEDNIRRLAIRLREKCEELKIPVPHIMLEPGRSIVATAGTTLYTVENLREIPHVRNYVAIDGSMNDNMRFALYGSKYTMLNASRTGAPADYQATIAGRCCESGDLIGEGVMIAKPTPGDILAVLGTGAYNYAMASNYNRLPRPALVIVKDGEHRLAVRRETYDDLLRNDI
ncbi:MAG: diaminopimelate decarboxylase [Oscillospiraceae bacterium]|nr:diaminopimelate decarboxylase [Oscillospiraceae bacterium]